MGIELFAGDPRLNGHIQIIGADAQHLVHAL